MSRFNPYENNGGTTLAVAGENFVVVGADTRMSEGYNILSRKYSKIVRLTSKCVLATAGMQADTIALQKVLYANLTMYRHNNGKEMSTPAIAQMLSNTLYYRRFFPYYTFNCLAGLDDKGVGCCFSYDAVGSFERVKYTSSGTGQSLIQPFLDNQVANKNQLITPPARTLAEVVDFVKDALTTAGERDIYTGDGGEVFVITTTGIEKQEFALKAD